MQNKSLVVVLGASEKPYRYSYKAIFSLLKYGYKVVAIGRKEGEVGGVKIQTGQPAIEDVDTITMYLSPENQIKLYDYILSLNPKRIIFNPGAENPELEKLALSRGIESLDACTLVMLSTGQFDTVPDDRS